MGRCIITGGNSGIGYQAALQILQKGYDLTLICRNEQRAQDACERIAQQTGGNVDYIIADLSNMSMVFSAAEKYTSTHNSLDVLINNAADFDLAVKSPIITCDGIERQFATNVVAPFLLSKLLLPILDGGRIINISSQGLCVFPFLTLDFDNLNGEKSYSPSKTYYQNKLALLMLSLYMRSQQSEVKIQAVRVTNVKIDMSRYQNIHLLLKRMYEVKSRFSILSSEMAKVYTALATDRGYDGFLYDEKCREVNANRAAYNADAQRKLMQILDGVVNR